MSVEPTTVPEITTTVPVTPGIVKTGPESYVQTFETGNSVRLDGVSLAGEAVHPPVEASVGQTAIEQSAAIVPIKAAELTNPEVPASQSPETL